MKLAIKVLKLVACAVMGALSAQLTLQSHWEYKMYALSFVFFIIYKESIGA